MNLFQLGNLTHLKTDSGLLLTIIMNKRNALVLF